MAIVQGQDTNRTNIGDYLGGLYFYALDYTHFYGDNKKNTYVFQWSPTIQTLCYNPFLSFEDMTLIETDFDISYFKVNAREVPKVYRCEFMEVVKTLATIDFTQLYSNEKDLDGYGESKLCLYPYRYFLLSDGLNPPYLIKPQLIRGTSSTVNVKITLSQSSKYSIYLGNNKKDDGHGRVDGIINNVPLLLPIGSNAYTSYFMTQGNTYHQMNAQAMLENDMTLKHGLENIDLQTQFNRNNALGGGISSVIGAVGSALTMNGYGVVSSLGNAFSTGLNYGTQTNSTNLQSRQANELHGLKEQNIEQMALAMKQDLLNTPRTMKTLGNDTLFNVVNAQHSLMLYEFGMNSERQDRIRRYFNRYGYKQNKYMTPNLNTRKYWDYVKTVNCNIDSSVIPHEDILKIEEIFNSGVTIWHVDNNAKIKDYYQNNVEV